MVSNKLIIIRFGIYMFRHLEGLSEEKAENSENFGFSDNIKSLI